MSASFCSRLTILVSSIALVFSLTGCNGTPSNSSLNNNNLNQITQNTEDKKKVLTTFTVLADMAQNVAGDKLTVE